MYYKDKFFKLIFFPNYISNMPTVDLNNGNLNIHTDDTTVINRGYNKKYAFWYPIKLI